VEFRDISEDFTKFMDHREIPDVWFKRTGIVLASLAARGLLANLIRIIYPHNKHAQQETKGCLSSSPSFVWRKNASKDSIDNGMC
jgi:hypothetical protein